jgi:serine/threonine protein kinase
MPNLADAEVLNLVEKLRGDPEQSESAWMTARDILSAEPERIAGQLCSLVDECMKTGIDLPVEDSIIVSLEAFTRSQPELLSEDMLRRILALAERLDLLSTLCIAIMYARLRPEKIITEGIQHALVATEHALVEPANDPDAQVRQYARKVAIELWSLVATRDPASLVALVEFWAAKVGWQQQTNHLFAELLVRVAPDNPSLINDMIVALETIRDKYDDPEGELESPDEFLKKLRELRDTLQRKAIAERITAGLDLDQFSTRLPVYSSPPAPKPDPSVDRLIDDLLGDDPDRRYQAKQRLGALMRDASPALIDGIREAADELFQSNPRSPLFSDFLFFLFFSTEDRPELVPVQSLQTWSRSDLLSDQELSLIYSTLARARPDWIVANCLPRALGAEMATSGGFLALLTNLAVA